MKRKVAQELEDFPAAADRNRRDGKQNLLHAFCKQPVLEVFVTRADNREILNRSSSDRSIVINEEHGETFLSPPQYLHQLAPGVACAIDSDRRAPWARRPEKHSRLMPAPDDEYEQHQRKYRAETHGARISRSA